VINSRIYLLTESFYPPNWDGVARHAHQLAERLAEKKQTVVVVTRQTNPPSSSYEQIGKMSVRRISPGGFLKGAGWWAIGPLLMFLVQLFYLLVKERSRYDFIVTCGLKVLPIPAVVACAIGKTKCIIRVESSRELLEDISAESLGKMGFFPRSVLLRVVHLLQRAALKRAHRIVAISSEIKRELIRAGVAPEKIESIPNGIDTNRFSSVSMEQKLNLRKKLSLPIEGVLFNFTGRLAATKGLPLLVQAWKGLSCKYRDIYLLLVGSGQGSFDSCEDELKDYIKLNDLKERVVITGAVDNVYEYLQASDVFVLPSEYEGFSITLMEALACALPTVATKVGGATELIRHQENGILINPRDQKELESAIDWLLDHKELWTKIGERARTSVVDKYSIDAVTNRYLEMFSNALRELPK
jgi:glycosyltransferase involved in cell wall biosynthesis